MSEQNAVDPATGTAHTVQRGRGLGVASRTTSSNSGFLMALIIGALALVLAFTAVTIALGRAPQPSDGQVQPSGTTSSVAPATTYASPTPTGEQLPAQPIQAPANQVPVYEPPIQTPKPTASASPSATSSSSENAHGNNGNGQSQPSTEPSR